MKFYYLFVFYFWLQLFCMPKSLAQSKTTRPLTIGDTIPNIRIDHVLNASNSSQLSELTNGKYYILDFFATWCAPCVKALPELEKFQAQYRDQLMIIPVTYEDSSKVIKLLNKRQDLDNNLEFITNSTELNELIAFKLLPHEVWVNNKGIISAITDGYQVTDDNIKKFISGYLLDLPIKRDNMNLDISKPLLIKGNGGNDDSFISRSLLTAFIDGGNGKAHLDRKDNGIQRIIAINLPIFQLYHLAYSKFDYGGYNRNRVIINVADEERYHSPKNKLLLNDWLKENAFSYELELGKAIPKEQFFQYMLEDLNRYFSVRGKVVNKSVPCLVLKRNSSDDSLLKTRSKEQIPAHTGKMRNMPMSNLVNYLNNYKNIEPVIDETDFQQNIDLDLDFIKATDIKAYPQLDIINNSLSKYGLVLEKEPRTIEVLLIEDK